MVKMQGFDIKGVEIMNSELNDKVIMNPGHTSTRSVMWYVDWIITAGVAGVVLIIGYMMFV
jgi:hypothetical protein